MTVDCCCKTTLTSSELSSEADAMRLDESCLDVMLFKVALVESNTEASVACARGGKGGGGGGRGRGEGNGGDGGRGG